MKVSLIVPPPGMLDQLVAVEAEAVAPEPVHVKRRSRRARRADLARTRAASDSVYLPEDIQAQEVAATWDDDDDDEETTPGEPSAQVAPPAPPPPPRAPVVGPARAPKTAADARPPMRKSQTSSRRVTANAKPKPRRRVAPTPKRRPRPVGKRPNPETVVIVGSGSTELEELDAQPVEP